MRRQRRLHFGLGTAAAIDKAVAEVEARKKDRKPLVPDAALAAAPAVAARDVEARELDFRYHDEVDAAFQGIATVNSLIKAGKVTGGTFFGAGDASTYCAMANAGYDFIWTEMQHNDRDWSQVSRCTAGWARIGAQCSADHS